MKWGIIFLFFLLIALAFSSYILISQFIGINSVPISLKIINPSINKNITSYPSGHLQYYPNMKFNHNVITYSIDPACSVKKITKIEKAFIMLNGEVNEISFKEEQNGDINIVCENKNVPSETEGYFIAGEGGPTSVINTSLFYVINKGEVLLFNDKTSCDDPIVEMHEILHVFGFEHSTNKDSLMYSVASCQQVFTKDIRDELKRLYTIENLPELYFSDINVTKHGNYLDFEVKIKNEGLVQANNITLEIDSLPSDKNIEQFDMKSINYGEGKYLSVENLKIPLRTKRIKFEIINGIEIENNNNIIEFNIE
jgi:hypothetical protein